MKNFAKKTLFFVFFFTLVFILVNSIYFGVIAITDWDIRKRFESLRFDNPEFELLVLGNSFPEFGIDTELLTSLGIKSYNLALVGSSDQTSYIQLNEYLTTYSKRPEYVLLCIASGTDPFYNEGIEPIVEVTMKDHKYNINDFPVSKFRWLGLEFLKKVISPDYRKVKIEYGQIKAKKATPDNTDYKDLNLDLQRIESSHWIGEVAKICKLNGIELIIVEMPGVRETQNLTEVGPFTLTYKNGYSAILYNFNSREFCTVFDPVKDWGGMSHLNQYGAAKFTNELNNIILKK